MKAYVVLSYNFALLASAMDTSQEILQSMGTNIKDWLPTQT